MIAGVGGGPGIVNGIGGIGVDDGGCLAETVGFWVRHLAQLG